MSATAYHKVQLVDESGEKVTIAGLENPFDQDLNTDDSPTFAGLLDSAELQVMGIDKAAGFVEFEDTGGPVRMDANGFRGGNYYVASVDETLFPDAASDFIYAGSVASANGGGTPIFGDPWAVMMVGDGGSGTLSGAFIGTFGSFTTTGFSSLQGKISLADVEWMMGENAMPTWIQTTSTFTTDRGDINSSTITLQALANKVATLLADLTTFKAILSD